MADSTRSLPYSEVDLGEVRRYINARANESSVRATAAEIGMRHTSLEKFLAGSEPYAKNRTLLCEFYLREHRVHPVRELLKVDLGLATPGNDLEAHLDALLSQLRGEARSEARLRITSALAQAYRRMGQAAPDWLYAS